MLTVFRCPVCFEPLNKGEKQYYCVNGHSFDIARKGYVNLLLPKHIGSGNPGDTKEMLMSRRQFLDKGFYEAFSDNINSVVINEINTSSENNIKILDAGCGEGYYIWRLKNKLNNPALNKDIDFYGIDVSKPAIHYASRRDKEIYFAVGSNYHIPLLDDSIDITICVFSPRDEKEFHRVIKPSGKLIVAAPGPYHLYSLRKEIYGDIEPIGQRGTVKEGFNHIDTINVSYDIYLNETDDILNLLTMTPYIRHIKSNALDKLKSKNEFKTEVNIDIMVYQKI